MEVSGATRLYGVIADPIAQLRTPQLLNPIFQRQGADILAIPFQVSADELQTVWKGFQGTKNLAGIGVAIPHKSAAAALCDKLDPIAEQLGVVSAVRRETTGEMAGAALDGPGFLAGLDTQGLSVDGKNALLVGAGGAGTAVALALIDGGVTSLTIANRNGQKAEQLVEKINQHNQEDIARVGVPDPSDYDVIVNATSLGLSPEDALPVDTNRLAHCPMIIDIIAQPARTRLLKIAEDQGCVTHSGVHMIAAHMRLVAEFITKSSHTSNASVTDGPSSR